MTHSPHPDWLALHIFYHDHLKQDALLLEGLLPEIRRLGEQGAYRKWFFLRYWEGGPHLRIRFFRADDTVEELVRRAASAFMTKHPPERLLTRDEYYRNHRFDGEPVDLDSLPWHENGSVILFPYFPELDRYGGLLAMPVSEDLFFASSELAVKIMRQTPAYPERVIRAMDIMVLTALSLEVKPVELAEYFRHYARFWRRYLDDPEPAEERIRTSFAKQQGGLVQRLRLLIRLARGEFRFELFRDWLHALAKAREAYQDLYRRGALLSPVPVPAGSADAFRAAVSAIAVSQIHMTNNRLGIPPVYEHYLGTMIQLAAEAYLNTPEGGSL
jgi:hypothetical protein